MTWWIKYVTKFISSEPIYELNRYGGLPVTATFKMQRQRANW